MDAVPDEPMPPLKGSGRFSMFKIYGILNNWGDVVQRKAEIGVDYACGDM